MNLQITSLLTTYGFLDGLTATIIIGFTIFFTTIVLITSRKMKARLLTYGALMGGTAGALWTGPCVNFIMVTFFNSPLRPVELYGILSYIWVAPSLIFAMYIGAELLAPSKKRMTLTIYIIAGILFEFFLFSDTKNIFHFEREGQYIDASFVYGHPSFLLIAFFLASVFILDDLGSLQKMIQSAGTVRKKFMYLAISIILFIIVGTGDSFINPGPILFILRIGLIISAICIYKALKPNIEKLS